MSGLRFAIVGIVAVVVICLAVFLSLSMTGQVAGTQNTEKGAAAVQGLDINAVVDELRQSPDYFEMSRYVNCAYTENLVTAAEVQELAESQPVIYGGIDSDAYRILFACAGEPSGLLVIYDPGSGEVLKTFIMGSAVW